ncbi:dermonecrotic toxin domain-containing protein [Pseudomonas sp. 5P_5.1_Bac1]|uniref:dermonecrotic toxin domain-containing protein n=1 Tax=Pseudomonas sp. 5P_5.1_Bac1 TaxID=2971616 RepID=UPI0021C9E85D|nr:DUF6543 domain-containing protein [Pseudomonas sp. 5P_5.1_Bac1]MCU1720566.1 hypothetical protein [Pseudomonas sp. 5P_5.1_Bac1]
MTPTLSPYGQLALNATLCGPIARYFASRPSFREVAHQIIEQQWRQRRIAGPGPALLRLYRWVEGYGYYVDTLADALIERFCKGEPVWLVEGQDFLSRYPGAEFPQASMTDLQAVQVLLNECGPFLLEEYKRQLVAYWVRGPQGGPSPWSWLANYLQEQCRTAVGFERSNGTLDAQEAATAMLLALYPDPSQRAAFGNLDNTEAGLLSLDVNPRRWLDADMASTLLVERVIPEQNRTLLMLYTLSGRWYRFQSRQALARMLAYGGERRGLVPFTLHVYATRESVFLSQVRLLLEQQLTLIDTIARSIADVEEDPVRGLVWRLDEATSLLQVCEQSQRQSWLLYFSVLPAWLKEGSVEDQRIYGDALLELTLLQQRSGGQSFLYAIPPILEYARDQVRAAILLDHPQATALDVDAVEVVNRRVIASGIAVGGDFFPSGTIETVRFTLPQFALENLSALRSGTVTLGMSDGSALPGWLTLDYAKALVTRLDLGKVYPELLRRELIDDSQVLLRRQALFIDQVRLQLPLLALEKKLRGQDGLTAAGVRLVNGVFRPIRGEPDVARLRPLSFIRRKGAIPDTALNAYLIERFDIRSGPTVLYRPLHRQPLREFASRAAFFNAVCQEPELQEDVLARLNEHARAIYANGGFRQPHVVRYTPGAEFGVFEQPPPADVGTDALSGEVLEHLYSACAQELLSRAEAQSLSNSENRWIGYQELGWVMLNTLLPLLNGPVAVSAWMLQVFADLQNDLRQPQPQEAQLVLHLFNFASLLISIPHGRSVLAPDSGMPEVEAALPVIAQLVHEPASSPSGLALSQLDFSWATATQRLSNAQRESLVRFQVGLTPGQLGSEVSDGPWAGLFYYDQRWWIRLEGQVYEVQVNSDEVQMVDALGRPGPWLYRDAAGDWRIDARVRLRGGMPLNQRIERMHAANRQRIPELEARQVELLSERLALNLTIEQDARLVGDRNPPSAQSLRAYADHLRTHSELMKRVDENYVELNALEAQADFSQEHGRYLSERVTSLAQRVQVLRWQLVGSMDVSRVLQARSADVHATVELRDQHYDALMAECEKARVIVGEAISTFGEAHGICQQLGKILPRGPEWVADYKRLRGAESSLWAWKASEFSITAALIIGTERRNDLELFESIKRVRLALQMQHELESDAVFTTEERIEILDSCTQNYVMARESMAPLGGDFASEQARRWLVGLVEALRSLEHRVEEELAALIRAQAGNSEEPVPPADRQQVVIKTRSRGVVVARKHKTKAGKAEAVVPEPLVSGELARFEETAEPGVWKIIEPVTPLRNTPESPQQKGVLASLLKRSAKMLSEADRKMQKARVQARTATIAVEIEEILINQASPLEQLARQVENSLSVSNTVEDQSGRHDAALQSKALYRKAAAMREEGRQLRISIIKTQPPTSSRVAYLKSQHEIKITRPKGREPTAGRKGQDRGYLQEYVISDMAGQLLWYAHFHYASLDAGPADFIVGHLKTREQRFDRGQYRVKMEKNSRKVIQIYRSMIDKAAAAELFLNL